jgi:hypothetical protein
LTCQSQPPEPSFATLKASKVRFEEFSLSRIGRFVVFSEEHSLFTFIISSSYGRSLTPVLESFHTRREELVRKLGSCERVPFSLATWHFGKRTNRHIIGSQNDLIYLLGGHLESAAPPVKEDLLRKIEDSLNQTPMSYLGMESPRAALRCRYPSFGFCLGAGAGCRSRPPGYRCLY